MRSLEFRIRTPFGCYLFSKQQFETGEFKNVAQNEKNYRRPNGSWSQTVPPRKAEIYLDFDPSKIDDRRYPIVELLNALVETGMAHERLGADEATLPDADEPEDEDSPTELSVAATDNRYAARNVIFFGPPGTGKSYRLKSIFLPGIGIDPATDDDRIFRVTFHPEMTYFDFVGAYKPLQGREKAAEPVVSADGTPFRTTDGAPARPVAYYGFEPGPFCGALCAALENPKKNVALVIEEINRGNCAAIFGDIFQLLDRAGDHRSEYSVRPSTALAAYLQDRLGQPMQQLQLPANLFLYATMNTSDQSLFPMDTAFKRRWSLEYVGIAFDDPAVRRVTVPVTEGALRPWFAVAEALNRRIVQTTGIDDRQMGPHFVRPDAQEAVSPSAFRSKVLFYLWNDVFRSERSAVFAPAVSTYDQLVAEHKLGRAVFRDDLVTEIDAAATAATE